MCGGIFFLPRKSCLAIGFLQIKFFLFTFAPKYNNAPYKTSARGNKPEFIIPKHILLPFRSVCQYLALSPVWLWDSPFSQGLESFKWGVTEPCQAAAVGSEGNEVLCHLYSPGVLTSISNTKWGRDFLLWVLLSPAIVSGLWELKKSIKNTCKDRSMRKKKKIRLIIVLLIMKFALWLNSFLNLGLTPSHFWGGIHQLFVRKELPQVHRMQLQSWHCARTVDLLSRKCQGIFHSHRSWFSPFGWDMRLVLLGKYGCRNHLPGV